jgi:hypothetical protein
VAVHQSRLNAAAHREPGGAVIPKSLSIRLLGALHFDDSFLIPKDQHMQSVIGKQGHCCQFRPHGSFFLHGYRIWNDRSIIKKKYQPMHKNSICTLW